MKFLYAVSMLIAIPVILFAFLIAAGLPLFIQHFFKPPSSKNNSVYPYLTSWEDAA